LLGESIKGNLFSWLGSAERIIQSPDCNLAILQGSGKKSTIP
jgi:hypothetical protein